MRSVFAAFRRELPNLLTIALPLTLAHLAQNAMTFVDTLMAGRLGPEALAGIALGGASLSFISVITSATLFAVAPLVAQATGAQDPATIRRTVRQGLLLTMLIAPVAMALIWAAGPLLLAMGQDPDTARGATGYLRAASFGVLPYMVFTVLRAYMEGQGNTRPLMFIAFFGVGLNILGNQAFMFGRWGFPALGITGTGLVTTLVYLLMAVVAVVYVARRYPRHRVFATDWRWDGGSVREIVRLGWPIALTTAFEMGMFLTSALLMGLIGPAQLAAHQVAIQTASFTFMIPLSLGVATSTRVGQAVGRGDPWGVRGAALAGVACALAVMVVTALLFLLLPMRVIGIYLDTGDPANAAVVMHALVFLRAAAAFQLFDGLQVSVLGALRGMKDTRGPMFITLVSYWVVGLGSGFGLAFGLGWEGLGLWYGLVIGLAVASIALTARLLRQFRVAHPLSGEGVVRSVP